MVETVEAALAGYQDVSVRENATFMLLASFVVTFASARGDRVPAARAGHASGRSAT